MLHYILKRLAISVATIWFVISLTFYMIRLMPGNAMAYVANQLIQQGGVTSQEITQRIHAIYGVLPTGPLWKQYLSYMGNIFTGNFGHSLLDPAESVLHIIAASLPWTIFIVAVALLLSFLIGISIGTAMAAFPQARAGKVATVLVTFVHGVPNYLIALGLIYWLTDLHHVFPLGGAYSPNVTVGLNVAFVGSIVVHGALPIVAYVITAFGGWALMMKGSVIATLDTDYVRTAHSWGLSDRRITQSYIGRNAMLPVVTSLALSLGYMFGGSVFIETFFSYPGIGYYLVRAVDSRNYPVMMGCFILITGAVVVANFLVDIVYPMIDPRITRPGTNGGIEKKREKQSATASPAVTGVIS